MAHIEFLKKELGVGSWSNKFQVDIPIPFILKASNFISGLFGGGNSNSDITDSIRLLAREINIPGRAIDTIDIWHRGHPFVVRGMANNPKEWKITFYNQSGLDLKSFFDDWIYKMDMVGSNILDTAFPNNALGAFGISSGYMVDIKIYKLQANGDRVKGYKLRYAFPKEVSNTDLKGDSKPSISELTVTFAYSYWEEAPVEDGIINELLDEASDLLGDIIG
jgi:hypothetical protein